MVFRKSRVAQHTAVGIGTKVHIIFVCTNHVYACELQSVCAPRRLRKNLSRRARRRIYFSADYASQTYGISIIRLSFKWFFQLWFNLIFIQMYTYTYIIYYIRIKKSITRFARLFRNVTLHGGQTLYTVVCIKCLQICMFVFHERTWCTRRILNRTECILLNRLHFENISEYKSIDCVFVSWLVNMQCCFNAGDFKHRVIVCLNKLTFTYWSYLVVTCTLTEFYCFYFHEWQFEFKVNISYYTK